MIFLLTLLLLTTPVYAGVDFSQMAPQYSYFIPKFKTPEEAAAWSHQVKWIEPLRERLEIAVENSAILVVMNTGNHNRKGVRYYESLLNRYTCYRLALSIMNEYRDQGIKGDPAMGATVVMSSVPVEVVK